MRKKMATTLAGALLIAGGLTVGVSGPAAAGQCGVIWVRDYTADYASSTRNGGDCSQVKVRHYAKPSGGAAYWTSWRYGANYAETYVARELQTSEHGYVP